MNTSFRLAFCAGLLFVIAFLAESCKQNTPTAEELIMASQEAVADQKVRASIENMGTLANCQSPNGSYTTEVQTSNSGYGYFKQVYSYRPEHFEAITQGTDLGYVLKDSSLALGKTSVYAIRSHYFHAILFDIRKWFQEIGQPVLMDWNGKKVFALIAVDKLDNKSTLYFDGNTLQLVSFQIVNPDKADEQISVTYSDWRETEQMLLPYHIDILQGDKKFTFDFVRIAINMKDFQERIPSL